MAPDGADICFDNGECESHVAPPGFYLSGTIAAQRGLKRQAPAAPLAGKRPSAAT
jgi:hypothetical protein